MELEDVGQRFAAFSTFVDFPATSDAGPTSSEPHQLQVHHFYWLTSLKVFTHRVWGDNNMKKRIKHTRNIYFVNLRNRV